MRRYPLAWFERISGAILAIWTGFPLADHVSVYSIDGASACLIFGQMGVIKHGACEFMIIGAYVTYRPRPTLKYISPEAVSGIFFLAMILAVLASDSPG